MKRRNGVLAFLICASLLTGLAGCGQTGTAEADFDSQYRYCNDFHLYTVGERGTLEQRTLQGEMIREITCDVSGTAPTWGRKLMCVNNEEIFYVVWNYVKDSSNEPSKDSYELWSVPLDESSHSPQMEKAEKILETKEGIQTSAGIYADARYIAWFTESEELREYDRSKKTWIAIHGEKGSDSKKTKNFYRPGGGSWKDAWEKTILLSEKEWTSSRPAAELYVHTIGSGTVKKLEGYSGYVTDDGDEDYCFVRRWPVASQGEVIAYLSEEKKGINWEEYNVISNLGETNICVYDCQTGKSRVLVTGKQIKKIINQEKKGRLWAVNALYIMGGKLYIEAETEYTGYYLLSCPLSEPGEVVYEKELNQFIDEMNRKLDEYSMLCVYDILENQCLFGVIDTEYDRGSGSYVWDFETGQGRKLEEQTAEWKYNIQEGVYDLLG